MNDGIQFAEAKSILSFFNRIDALNYFLSAIPLRFVNVLKLEFIMGVSSSGLLKTICHMPRVAGKF